MVEHLLNRNLKSLGAVAAAVFCTAAAFIEIEHRPLA
jgi:hypothetical protein